MTSIHLRRVRWGGKRVKERSRLLTKPLSADGWVIHCNENHRSAGNKWGIKKAGVICSRTLRLVGILGGAHNLTIARCTGRPYLCRAHSGTTCSLLSFSFTHRPSVLFPNTLFLFISAFPFVFYFFFFCNVTSYIFRSSGGVALLYLMTPPPRQWN